MSDGAWQRANQRHLMASVEAVRALLEAHAEGRPAGGAPPAVAPPAAPAPETDDEAPETEAAELPALEVVTRAFDLSAFERQILVLAAGVELDGSFAAACERAHGDRASGDRTAAPLVTFSLALAVLPDAHWSALSPTAPLRRWQLLEVGAGDLLTSSPLRVDERILHYLTGVSTRDERLAGLMEPVPATADLVPSHDSLAERIAATWMATVGGPDFPVIQLCGDEASDKREVAASACARLGLGLWRMPADALPTAAADLDRVIRLWNREAILGGGALLLDCEQLPAGGASDTPREGAVGRVVEGATSPLILSSLERRRLPQRPVLSFEVEKPTAAEQRGLWRRTLEDLGVRQVGAPDAGRATDPLDEPIERLVGQFHLSEPMIRAACGSAAGSLPPDQVEDAGTRERAEALGSALWHTCRVQARPRLEDLAQRIRPGAAWEDLVLPEQALKLLHEIAQHVRLRSQVIERWGFAARSGRGLGLSALFAGVSGTGKTLAAEVLANELSLDLFRIDLSSVVSKYIGETEKNLRRVFAAAEAGGAILLFDEADALFGKRTEVKDSHDRYANLEVSYLLQRMESYRGLAILTSNLKDSVDKAFLRRFRFIVDFAFPGVAQREEIWRRVFPAETPVDNLLPERLARLNVPGGNIRNIALTAAFLAAGAGEPVRMEHLLAAARQESLKIGKNLTDVEIEGWV